MSKKIYCSIGPVPKGSKLGTMKECAEMNQIRLYGLKKADPKLIESIRKSSKRGETRDKLGIKMIGLRAKVKRLNKEISAEKDKKKKDKLMSDLAKAKKELTEVHDKFIKADKERSKTGGSRRKSRRASRKVSRKISRKASRKTSRKVSRKTSRRRSRNH